MKAEVKVEVKMGEDRSNGVVDGETEAIDVPLRPEEKRRLNWENGLYLAPLTTVGNLVSWEPRCCAISIEWRISLTM